MKDFMDALPLLALLAGLVLIMIFFLVIPAKRQDREEKARRSK
jgi:hypothetical protein